MGRIGRGQDQARCLRPELLFPEKHRAPALVQIPDFQTVVKMLPLAHQYVRCAEVPRSPTTGKFAGRS